MVTEWVLSLYIMLSHIFIATAFLVFSPKKSIVMTSPPWLSWFHAFLRWSLQHPPFLIPPSLLSQQRNHEIFSRRSGDRASLGFVPGMNLDLLGMNWYLDRFVPVSSMVTFRVIILPWPMGNPSNCPIWSRGHCVLWSFYLWIGSAFSKPENIFELRLLPIPFRFGFKRGTRSAAKLPSDRSHWSFLIFPVNGVWLAPWPLQQAIGNSWKYFSRYFGWCSIPFDRELYFWNTSSAPPPLPPLQLQCVSECPIKAIWAWSLQCTRAQPDKTLCRPPCNNRLRHRVLLSTRSVNCSFFFKLKSEWRCMVT